MVALIKIYQTDRVKGLESVYTVFSFGFFLILKTFWEILQSHLILSCFFKIICLKEEYVHLEFFQFSDIFFI